MYLIKQNSYPPNTVQAALVIRGFGIRGFDYSRMQKLRIARENFYFEPKLGLF
jgi:hypothetical protein